MAGASADMARAVYWMDRLRGAAIEVVSTWPERITAVGEANPRDWSRADRERAAVDCLLAVESAAELLWLLVPPVGTSTSGAWVEFCAARRRGLQVIASGDTKQSIFTALVPEFDSDEAAFEMIVDLCKGAP